MAELLLELFSEEIPARMQARAAADLGRLVTDGLKKAGLAFAQAREFSTPRRLALVVEGLPEAQPDVREEKRGPKVGAPERAVQGFLGSVGLTLDKLEQRETPKGAFYFAVVEQKGRATAEVLTDVLHDAICDLPWQKSMRWSNFNFRWVRPLHNILAIFDGKPIELAFHRIDPEVVFDIRNPENQNFHDTYTEEMCRKFGVLLANNIARGHRFMVPMPFAVSKFAEYQAGLRRAKVILDPAERRRIIEEDAKKTAEAEGLSLADDPRLLDEVSGLVEWPVVLMGRIDEAYMDVPSEVLTTAMRSHQKYFSCHDKQGKLAARFITVANLEARDGGAQIIAGNEKVLSARLHDAKFFWDQDRKRTLESRVPELESLIFNAKLGTVAEKVTRLQALVGELAWYIPGVDTALAERAAFLAKADLVSGMVGEFPELQGLMGRYYALHEGTRHEVADAIAEHYSPQGPGDRCPSAPVSVAVALADKIDTLVGFFAIDEKPTGSKDPYALRRAALGVIRLVLENKLRVPLFKIFDSAYRLYEKQFHWEGKEEEEHGLPVSSDLLAFFADRLKVHLRGQGVRHDLIAAVFALGGEDDLVRLLARVDALSSFLETDDGVNLLVAYRRAANILRIEEKKDGRSHDGEVDETLLSQNEERALAEKLETAAEDAVKTVTEEDFAGAMVALAGLRRPVDGFFDEVTVNCDDGAQRENRLRLLSRIRRALAGVADFSKIEG